MLENKLKTISVKDLETVIAKAISETIKEETDATISSIEYGKSMFPEATFQIKINKAIKFGEDT